MFKKIFNPKYMMLFSLIPYLIFSIYSYLNDKSLIISIIFISLGFLTILYYLFFNKNRELRKVDFWIIAIISVIIVFIFIICTYDIDRINNLTMPILIASIPVVYNIMGIASFVSLDDEYGIGPYIIAIFIIPFIITRLSGFILVSSFGSIQVILEKLSWYIIVFLILHICFSVYKRRLINDKKVSYGMAHYITTFMLGLFLPIAGLALNLVVKLFDFSSPIFFVIAIINGTLLLLPIPENKNARLLLFYLKSVGYCYILYFFIVFIPLFQVGLIAIFLIVGLLIIAPPLIAFWQGRLLFKEWKALKSSFNSLLISAVFLIGILTIPIVFVIVSYNDRINLVNAIEYTRGNNIKKESINVSALKRSLDLINGDYSSCNWSDFLTGNTGEGSTPLIPYVYNKIVFQGETLFIDNLYELKNNFFGEQ